VQKAINARREFNECAIFGDVLDNAFAFIALIQFLDDFLTLFGAIFFKDGAARNDDVAAAFVHLQNAEGLRDVHQRAGIAHWADIHLAAWQERNSPAEIDGEAAFDAIENFAIDTLVLFERSFETIPSFFAACFLAADHGFAIGVFNALDENFYRVSDLKIGGLAGLGKFFEGDAPFGLETDIDHRDVFFDGGDFAFDDRFFKILAADEGGFKHFREIVAGRVKSFRHECHILQFSALCADRFVRWSFRRVGPPDK